MDRRRIAAECREIVTPEDQKRFRAGDPALFRSLVEDLSPRLLGYAINLTGDHDQAADLLQETWVQAYRRRDTFRGEGPLLGWLVTIAYNRFASERRGEARRLARRAEAHAASGPSAGSTLGAESSCVETRQALAAALAELPERQRSVVVCRLLEDRSVRETAVQLGIAEGTVKATLHQAIQRLRHLLRDWAP